MKAPARPSLPALAAAIVCGAGLLPASLDAAEPEYTILDAGPNHREIEWVAEEADAAGHRSRVTHSYVELEPGLCYAEPGSGKWVPSRAEFEQAESGHFVARQTQFQVILAPDLGEAGAVDVLTPEGVRLVSTPRGIALLDVDSGKSVTQMTGSPYRDPLEKGDGPAWCDCQDTVVIEGHFMKSHQASYVMGGAIADLCAGVLPFQIDPTIIAHAAIQDYKRNVLHETPDSLYERQAKSLFDYGLRRQPIPFENTQDSDCAVSVEHHKTRHSRFTWTWDGLRERRYDSPL